MEVRENLKELNMTVEEIDKLREAFKDETFKEMLCDYIEEMSDPENKKRYEEEITLLEQERGNRIELIPLEPFRAFRTSVNGKQKCFINICANDKIGKHDCKFGVSEDGRRGLHWSLPHSLHPGRQDTDPKGNQIHIYDVVFHPDTLHIASKNQRLMDLVDNIVIQYVSGVSSGALTCPRHLVPDPAADVEGDGNTHLLPASKPGQAAMALIQLP
ncbi:hypothetical protein F2P81_003670 [Scophthalmus maximus]|uniref:PIH1 N-terminal domain-containing protein n=1 Tax=Scophthalmus maximus TaxID=52904 RepID=A0A6A4TR65_SCOMX|nr:hypothetical protein F2P81_003670 [Scophthalmus maximus]